MIVGVLVGVSVDVFVAVAVDVLVEVGVCEGVDVRVKVAVGVNVDVKTGPPCVWMTNWGASALSSLLPKLIAVLLVVMSAKLYEPLPVM